MLHLERKCISRIWRSTDRGEFRVEHREKVQKTQLWTQQVEMEGKRQTDDEQCKSATGEEMDQPQRRAANVNKASSANSETSADRRYNIRSWLATPKDDTSTKRKAQNTTW
jgi:hypothetical protein